MGMQEEEFYRTTPRTFGNKLTGFRRREDRENQIGWEQVRMLAAFTLAPHARKGKRIDPKKIMQFPWDENEAAPVTEVSEEEKQSALDVWAQIDKTQNK